VTAPSTFLPLALGLALLLGGRSFAAQHDLYKVRPKLAPNEVACEEQHRKKVPHCFGIAKEKDRQDCLIAGGRAFRDCLRKAKGIAPINWKLRETCAAKHRAAVKAAKCHAVESHIECLRPIFRQQESCLRVAAGLPAHDHKKLDACRATLKACEEKCGSHEPTPAGSTCRGACFQQHRVCRDGPAVRRD
jgi:hypothetical protein